MIQVFLSPRWKKFFYLFFSKSSKLSQLYHHGDSSKPLQGFTLCFQLLFPFVWSFFYYRSSSWRLYMMVHQGFNSFSKCSLRLFSEELKFSSSCNPECYSLYLIFWDGVMSFWLLPSCVMIHELSGMTYFKPVIFNSFMRSFATHQYLQWSYLGLYFT